MAFTAAGSSVPLVLQRLPGQEENSFRSRTTLKNAMRFRSKNSRGLEAIRVRCLIRQRKKAVTDANQNSDSYAIIGITCVDGAVSATRGGTRMSVENIAGVVLAVVSFVLVIVSRVQLGKAFAVTPQAKDLVTHGVYSRLRHPMYVFLDLAICGIALAVGRWYVLLPLAILVPLQMRNARREGKLLQEKFGERYEAYRRGTWL